MESQQGLVLADTRMSAAEAAAEVEAGTAQIRSGIERLARVHEHAHLIYGPGTRYSWKLLEQELGWLLEDLRKANLEPARELVARIAEPDVLTPIVSAVHP